MLIVHFQSYLFNPIQNIRYYNNEFECACKHSILEELH